VTSVTAVLLMSVFNALVALVMPARWWHSFLGWLMAVLAWLALGFHVAGVQF
jgi:hypothetical protein